MSGTLITLLDMTSFNFDQLAANGKVTQLVASNLDVSRWSHGDLLIRVHARTIGTNASLKVELRRALPSSQDPSRNFEQDGSAIATKTLNGSTTVPSLQLEDLTEPLGGYLNLYVIAEQAGTPTTVSATISVELVLKS